MKKQIGNDIKIKRAEEMSKKRLLQLSKKRKKK